MPHLSLEAHAKCSLSMAPIWTDVSTTIMTSSVVLNYGARTKSAPMC